jgi:exonuclease VII large subunit
MADEVRVYTREELPSVEWIRRVVWSIDTRDGDNWRSELEVYMTRLAATARAGLDAMEEAAEAWASAGAHRRARDEYKQLYEMHYEGMGALAEEIKRKDKQLRAEIEDRERLDRLEREGHSLMYYGPGKWDCGFGVRATTRAALDTVDEKAEEARLARIHREFMEGEARDIKQEREEDSTRSGRASPNEGEE